ncbi:hypothetical protein V6N13_004364 [Hibiscus sabdariffa]
MQSGVPTAVLRTQIRARVSSHIFLMSLAFRPIMLPTFATGTMSRNTQRPDQPDHFSADGLKAVVSDGSPTVSESLLG